MLVKNAFTLRIYYAFPIIYPVKMIQNRPKFSVKMDLFLRINGKRIVVAWLTTAWLVLYVCRLVWLSGMIALMANGGELNGKRILSQAGTIEAVKNPVVASERPHEVCKTLFWRHFRTKPIILPRQARDGNAEKKVLYAGGAAAVHDVRLCICPRWMERSPPSTRAEGYSAWPGLESPRQCWVRLGWAGWLVDLVQPG